MSKTKAWVLTAPGGHMFAVGESVMIELDVNAKYFPVPLTPYYCDHIVFWRRRLIPMFNFGKWFDKNVSDAAQKIAILAYQTEPMTPLQHVAVVLQEYPERITVDDEQVCELPAAYASRFPKLARTAFIHHGKAVPVLDVKILSTPEFLAKILNTA